MTIALSQTPTPMIRKVPTMLPTKEIRKMAARCKRGVGIVRVGLWRDDLTAVDRGNGVDH